MQLIDIKNDLAKIVYTPLRRELFLADFLIIGDDNQNLLSQIIHIESTQKPNTNLALVKFILSVDKEGIVSPYNGYVPTKEAVVSYMDTEEIAQLLKNTEETIPWGNIATHKETFVSLDINFIKNNLYIQCDRLENSSDVVNNIFSGIRKNNKKVLLIDFDGYYSDVHTAKITLTKDFKLPLDYESLDQIYEYDLDGLDLQSRAMVQDIILDLQQYVKTTKNGFLPFDTFKTIVSEEYKKNQNPSIILLRNKLLKYAEQNLFAQDENDYSAISAKTLQEDVLSIDVSTVRPIWQKKVLRFILSQIKDERYVILPLTDVNSDKTIITEIYRDFKNIHPIVMTSYSYKEAQLLKAIAKNLVLFSPIERINDFAGYSSFLSKLNCDEFIVWGEDTLQIPIILKLQSVNKTHLSNQVQNEISRCVDNIFRTHHKEISTQSITIPETSAIEADTEFQEHNVLSDNEFDSESTTATNKKEDQLISTDTIIEDDNDIDLQQNNSTTNEFQQENLSSTVTPNPTISSAAIPLYIPNLLAEENEEVKQELISIDDIEIVENVIEEDIVEEDDLDYENVFTDEDLDLIDEMNTPEPIQSVPVFRAETEVRQDALGIENCQEGTFVHHPKYGKGFIEKVISYGNKTLCSIQFDNVGRRLLDPNLAELTQAY